MGGMTKKTGQKALKARQLAREAKLAKYKQMLAEYGESLELPKASPEEQKKKEEELRNLYLEILKKKESQT
ncbi:MAG: hypothetical protein DSO02_00625 [Hadesarchaea archaeon]|nr:MAG: hypothetical protein DSO03_05355 [Hadesarchaea archaeon]TDA36231.1 MAG: hypothetical protein DSO02_00625 [Hadesarchaea archaeon]